MKTHSASWTESQSSPWLFLLGTRGTGKDYSRISNLLLPTDDADISLVERSRQMLLLTRAVSGQEGKMQTLGGAHACTNNSTNDCKQKQCAEKRFFDCEYFTQNRERRTRNTPIKPLNYASDPLFWEACGWHYQQEDVKRCSKGSLISEPYNTRSTFVCYRKVTRWSNNSVCDILAHIT